MTLASGTRLGRYEIRLKIGEDWIGEAYLAVCWRGPASLLLSNDVAAARWGYWGIVRKDLRIDGQTCG
jgi:hypothetical protein